MGPVLAQLEPVVAPVNLGDLDSGSGGHGHSSGDRGYDDGDHGEGDHGGGGEDAGIESANHGEAG